MFEFLQPGSHKPNIPALKNAVNRLIVATTQKTGGQHGENPDKYVNFQSPEIDLIKWIIICEAVALVLSGELDSLEK